MDIILSLFGIIISITSAILGYKFGQRDFKFKKLKFEELQSENNQIRKELKSIDGGVETLKDLALRAKLKVQHSTDASINEPVEWVFLKNCIEIEKLAANIFFEQNPDWQHSVIGIEEMYNVFKDEGYIDEDQRKLLLKIRKVKKMITDGWNLNTTREQVIEWMDISIALNKIITNNILKVKNA